MQLTLKNRFITLAILIGYILFPKVTSSADQFKVVRVSDGDTINAESDENKIKVRLVGIDAPETKKGKRNPGQPYSQRAKSFLASMVLNKKVVIKDYGEDRYGRILGVVYLDNTDVNLEMIKAGLAEVYRGRQPKGLDIVSYRDAEKSVKMAGKGRWSLGDKYVSPKVWRKEH